MIKKNELTIVPPKNEARWVAGLSNGEIAVEGSGKFKEIKDELSPWQKLESYLTRKKLRITSLQVKIKGRTYTLPSTRPKFRGEIPIDYAMKRMIAAETTPDDLKNIKCVEKYICIEAIYKDFVVELWVDEMGKKDAWINVKLNNPQC